MSSVSSTSSLSGLSNNAVGVSGAVPMTPSAFAALPEAQKLQYLQTFATGQPPSLLLQDGTDGALATQTSAGTVEVDALPSTFNNAPGAIAPNDFQNNWPTNVQRYYIQHHGSGTPPLVVIGTGSNALVAGLDNSGAVLLGSADTFTNPATLSPAIFAAMPVAAQTALVASWGVGTPPAAVVGSAALGGAILATANADGSVSQESAPADLATVAPSAVSAATFSSWSPAQQHYFITKNGAGTPPAVVVGTGQSALAAGLDATTGQVVTAPITSVDPSVSLFEALDATDKAATVQKLGSGTPKAAVIGTVAGAQILATITDTTTVPPVVTVDDPLPAAIVAAPAALSASTFEGWSATLQAYYLQTMGAGSPPFATIGSGTATVLAGLTTTGSVLVGQTAATIVNPTTISADYFAALPPAVQLAEIQGYGQQVAGTSPTLYTAMVGPPGQQRLATNLGSTTTATAITLDTLPPGFGTPATASQTTVTPPQVAQPWPAAFLGWPAGAQLEYLRSNVGAMGLSPGSAPFLTLGPQVQTAFARNDGSTAKSNYTTGTGATVVVGLNAAGTAMVAGQSGVAITFSTLTPKQFLLLPAAQQLALVTANATTSPASIQLTSHSPKLLASATISGVTIDTLSNDFGNHPSGLKSAEFLSWPATVQRAYLLTPGNGTGSPLSATIDVGANAIFATLDGAGNVLTEKPGDSALAVSGGNGTVDASAIGALYNPGTMTPTAFKALPANVQAAIFAAHRSGTPPSMLVKSGTSDGLLVSLDSSGNLTTMAVDANFLAGPTGFGGSVFAGWNAVEQAAFVNIYGTGTPKQVLVGQSYPFTLGTMDASGNVTTEDFVSGSDDAAGGNAAYQIMQKDPASVELQDWNSFSANAQLYYINQKGTATTPPSVLLSDMGVFAAVDGNTVTQVNLYLPPTLITSATFASLSNAAKAFYFSNHAGTASSITIGQGGNSSRVTKGSSGGYTLTSISTGLGQPYIQVGIPTQNAAITTAAQTVNPILDGTAGHTVDTSALVDSSGVSYMTYTAANLPSAVFLTWDSAAQLQYLRTQTPGSDGSIQIGNAVASATNGTAINVFIAKGLNSADPRANKKIYIVQQLQKQDIMTMAPADQNTLAGIGAFTSQGGQAQTLGLIPGYFDGTAYTAWTSAVPATTDPTYTTFKNSALGSVLDPITQAINLINNTTSGNITTVDGNSAPWGDMPSGDRAIFVSELTALSNSVQGSSVFSPTDIKTKLQAIMTRFDRANAFATAVYGANAGVQMDGSGAGKSSTYYAAYQTFIQQEQTITNVQNEATALANNTQHIDVPNLVYQYQLFANLIGTALVSADTEEVEMTNNLLQIYSQMQQAVENTENQVQQSSSDSAEQTVAFTPGSCPSWAYNLFDSRPPASGTVGSTPTPSPSQAMTPIEIMLNMTGRSLENLDQSNKSITFSNWQIYGQELTSAVSQINQGSQLKMNDIDSETKQKDRNFDMANTALQKMTEILQQIGAAVGA